MRRALQAGKPILAQKSLALEAQPAREVDTLEFGRGVFPQIRYLTFLNERRPDLPLIFEHLPYERIPAAVDQACAVRALGR